MSNVQSGFAALIAIVAIGAAALLIAYNASLIGLGELESGYTSQQGSKAFSIADGCMDEALRRLRINPALTGPLPILVSGGGSCSVTISPSVASTAGPPATCATFVAGTSIGVTATGCTAAVCPATIGYSKKICAELTINTTNQINAITISRWEEIP